MRKFIRFAAGIAGAAMMSAAGITAYYDSNLPDSYYIVQGQDFHIDNTKFNVETENFTADKVINGITVNEVSSLNNNAKTVSLKLFGIIPIKEVFVKEVNDTLLIPGGNPFGVKLFTNGVMVVSLDNIDSDKGLVNPAREAGIKIGDIVVSINGEKMDSNEAVSAAVKKGENLNFEIRRKDEILNVDVVPVKSKIDGSYKIGMWVRDSSAGIGTMSFYDTERHVFGGLGHPICDVDTGEVLPVLSGEIVDISITGVIKGTAGSPGELKGSFLTGQAVGELIFNGNAGIFGKTMEVNNNHAAVPMAMKQQVKVGPAKILTTVSGNSPKEYDIFIEKVNYSEAALSQNIIIKVTDRELIDITGGIVQGMSGSPIIQEDKLVGAVTHVFVNDPLKGYGIFAENMYNSSKIIED